ncbi:2,3-dihydroxybenzoate decarboxylase/5-carboxyvanillate decarboxylase [Altererythrobacter atlanticus]|uniref:Amidohydrolase n=1 Tax=Croceibacterium atlanticum TaxID=1267766 RepID=A0A0F7KZG7_9SPHN|nr:amidohydrolase family protein [Croceibacterium atlanticum]AKH44230.1 Amidohydrolase [Croceibacterium atlanticum]MBB5732541.1 2,3-dihydroxybenzoate decarboxylase/5-carboxyvanillate decarboxylase [Croceibacterium atlanticum]
MRLIATEEAWSIPEVAAELKKVANSPTQSLDKLLVKGIYDAPADTSGYGKLDFLSGLTDVEEHRLKQMDELGVDMHLLSLTAPGVQMFDADTATDLAALANDRMAEICAKYPKRFAGLASFAPHSPKRAAKEIDRAMSELKLNGLIVNSHTYGEYFDDPKFWPILEAAEAHDACIYIHPRGASDTLKGPLQDYGMDSAMWGYGVEVGTHAVRMMAGGVFDAFPNLKICIGHMGEAIPFWIWRINFMNTRAQQVGRARKTQRSMEEYFRDNFVFTTSGVEDHLALRYSIDRMGIDNVIWAIDYPYQPMAPAVEFIKSAPLTEAERHAVCHGNAERVFHIAPE